MGADNAKIQLDEVNNVNEFKITADVEFNRPYIKGNGLYL